MKKRNGIKKRLLSLMLTAAMMAGGVPNPANLVLADELNNKIINESTTKAEALTETEFSTENETQSGNETTIQEETATEEVSETEAVEDSTEKISEILTETVEETQTETQTVEETTESPTEETESETLWDGVTTENIYEAENFKVTFTLTSYWNTGYNASVKIENVSDIAIENWYLDFDYNGEIINIWNAQIYEKTQNGYIIKNAGWNQDIPAGSFVEFGISGNEGFKGFPKKYEIQGSSSEVKTEDYTVAYNLQSDWVSGFVATIAVTNNTDKTLED